MTATLTINDETTPGTIDRTFTLEFPTDRITVRELIRERVYQEVDDYNRQKRGPFRGLIQPVGAVSAAVGFSLMPGKEIDWKAQVQKACEAFESSRVLVLAGDRQTESLDETIEITRGVEVTFLKLVPLAGG